MTELTEPTQTSAVTIDGIEATAVDVRPSRQRGETTEIDVAVTNTDGLEASAVRYDRLKRYQVYAGEADVGVGLGGRPYVREHPLDQWRVDSHVVPVIYSADIADQSFWGVIVGVSDETQMIAPGLDYAAWGEQVWGTETWAANLPDEAQGNVYRLTFEIAPLAQLYEYNDRSALLADLSPRVNQLSN